MKSQRKKALAKAFAVAQGDTIDLNRIEPFTNDGRKDALRTINRPSGERVVTVIIREQ